MQDAVRDVERSDVEVAAAPPSARTETWHRLSQLGLSRPAASYGLLAFAAIGYSIGVALPLALAGASPMPAPFLRIPDSEYFYWGTFFYAPVIVGAWLLGSGSMFVSASALKGVPDFR